MTLITAVIPGQDILARHGGNSLAMLLGAWLGAGLGGGQGRCGQLRVVMSGDGSSSSSPGETVSSASSVNILKWTDTFDQA